ncbi:hypothetical protein LTS08_001654 [Lithohypha guttulata]|uniref:uncharacterized protein n=1 Tax=Lithohypha guttulata TaxID=1690604 RepID=UPI002DE085ED|nr:hypothetical protein LTR51_003662 [Lithohypha guttulata]KAK5105377.1 hypothetical protein LTS08_001654 [Lithohypha guttulata]
MPPKNKYTDPKLREEVKEELKAGDKGGAPGQWSARKAQMMASEYKKRGGDYTTDKTEQDESQKHLSKWTEEEWQTKEGSGEAKQADGSRKRYLPKKAWEKMTEEEKQETEEKKLEEGKGGKQQFVQNTTKAKKERKAANDEEDKKFEKNREQEKRRSARNKKEEAPKSTGDAGAKRKQAEVQDEVKTGDKRKKTTQASSSRKKQKDDEGEAQPADDAEETNDDSKHEDGSSDKKHKADGEPAPRGSVDRLPEKGQKAFWKSGGSKTVEGTVQDILTKAKKIDGKNVKATESDPRIVLKGNAKDAKLCVHKPDACYYD